LQLSSALGVLSAILFELILKSVMA
jgi:hypothetical protein